MYNIPPTPFYKKIIDYWQKLKATNQMTSNEILNQNFLSRKNILTVNKPVHVAVLQISPIQTNHDKLNKNLKN